eukprot:scaffold10171_cov446-Chaetoceros_neogracile.AAC.6
MREPPLVRISYESRDPGMRGAGNGMASRPVSRRSRSRYPGRDRTLNIAEQGRSVYGVHYSTL